MSIVSKAKEFAILERSFLSAGLMRLAGFFGRVNNGGKQTQADGKFDPPRVDEPVAVVGDIHVGWIYSTCFWTSSRNRQATRNLFLSAIMLTGGRMPGP